jgi:hypothetical protein
MASLMFSELIGKRESGLDPIFFSFFSFFGEIVELDLALIAAAVVEDLVCRVAGRSS